MFLQDTNSKINSVIKLPKVQNKNLGYLLKNFLCAIINKG